MSNFKGVLLILFSALMFGSYGTLSRLIGDSFGVFFQAWVKALLIVICLLPIIIWRGDMIKIPRKDWKWFFVYLVFTSFTQAPVFYAFNHMDIGSATLLFFVSMLLTMNIFGILFLGEKFTKVKVVSVLLAVVGMYIVFSFSLLYFTMFALLMAVLNGIASGGEVSSSKKLTGSYSALYVTWLSWVIIIITNAPISFILGEKQYLPSFNLAWLYLVVYGLVSLFAFWFVIEGLKTVEAGIGGLLGLMEIVFSILFGIIIFHEELTFRVIIGALLIIIASALPNVVELITKNKKILS